jgi:deoxyribodipyrimidine photo-lyase
VIRATLGRHSIQASEKFIQEVFWRTYWKGWLEMRPSVWTTYQNDLGQLSNQLATQSGFRQRWEEACLGRTGIDCFDAWAIELAQTGYLHNHARMWFASIWIFTLRLPWQLGADFFLRHLLDGDPAPNTLSWRWVAGLQTVGKTYLARASNIAKYTDGRFFLKGLAKVAIPLSEEVSYSKLLPVSETRHDQAAHSLLVLHDEDSHLGPIANEFKMTLGAVRISTGAHISPFASSEKVLQFVDDLMQEQDGRWSERLGSIKPVMTVDDIVKEAQKLGVTQIVSPYAAVGPAQDMLQNLQEAAASYDISIVRYLNAYDLMCWPHATHGFFRSKEHIPKFVQALGLKA